jgi:hypothetical protein
VKRSVLSVDVSAMATIRSLSYSDRKGEKVR